ncbi:hypothetical protein [Meiothermus sp. CFH 77666]|uniref:hypothetical protein n=1 Tax=Meiothermus sp. CFH 77666 TaxID=2817942 RepID=UPI001FB0E960|nr:hypothetical protein [Meiothermus sp. CFH 77666]
METVEATPISRTRQKAAYDRSLAHRLGLRACAKRQSLSPAEIEHRQILEVITGSREAAEYLAHEFPTLYALAQFGSRYGFKRLEFCPGVSYAAIGKLEVWLESQGRVGIQLTVDLLDQLSKRITPDTTPEQLKALLEQAKSYLTQEAESK